MTRTTRLLSGAIVALVLTGTATAQPRPVLRLPSSVPPVSSQAGRPMPQVAAQPGPQSANPQGAGNRAEQIADSRLAALETQVAQLTAALQAEQTARQALQTRFDGHRHSFRSAVYHWHNQRVVRNAHATGDDYIDVGVIDNQTVSEHNTEPPAPDGTGAL